MLFDFRLCPLEEVQPWGKPPDEEKILEAFELANSWQYARQLDAAYLQNAPRIWLWSNERSVIISWDSADILLEGIQVWSAKQGHYHLKRDEFIDEVRAFHHKLMSEMAERVESVCNRWSRPEIFVDTEHLRYEQKDRETWLEHALKKPSYLSWDKVRSASYNIRKLVQQSNNSRRSQSTYTS